MVMEAIINILINLSLVILMMKTKRKHVQLEIPKDEDF